MTLREQTEQLRENVLTKMPQSIVQNFKNDIAALKTNKLKSNALKVGDSIPNAVLQTIQNNDIDIKSIHNSDFLILNFYRGGWCPYCNMELRAYEKIKSEFSAINTNIVAISAELPTFAKETTQKNEITFPILTDKNAEFMKKIGVIFSLSEAAKKDFVGFGLDLDNIHGNKNQELPVPAIYVIDKNLKILFVHFEEDYMTRLEPSELLTLLKNKII